MSVPAADELFRPTVVPDAPGPGTDDHATGAKSLDRTPSGRVRHDEKMTIYVTSDELLDIEHTRLMLRRNNRLAVDRGRLVREAVAIAIADFEAHGDDSVIVQRLTQA